MNSVENKIFVWKLLINNNVFSKLTDIQIENIYNKYDLLVSEINEKYNNETLTIKNKKLIDAIQNITNEINTEKNELHNVSNNAITSEDIKLIRQEHLNEKLNSKKNEFDDLINIKKPKQIDFSDEKEVPLNDIENVLSSAITNRNADLNIDYTKINNNNNNNFINIGESVDISNQTINTISNNMDNNMDNNIELLNKIIEIENTQKKILNILTEVVSVINNKDL
tara:strand:- start:614 stop:1288 length:675 start_codon:yes stop_codon:yes gene_type:complete